MKKSIVLFLFAFISTCAFAVGFDYVISDTYYDDTLTLNSESLQVTGEGVYTIISNGASYVEVIDTTPHQRHVGGITYTKLYGTSVANISGGDIDVIYSYDDSILNISRGKAGVDALAYNNSVVNMSGGTTGSYFIDNNSRVNLSGGEMNGIFLRDDATFIISGGSINYIKSYQYSNVLKHITFFCDVDSVSYSGNLLTGNWLDGNSFSITLNDQSSYDSVYSNIEFITEPATLLLVAIGALVLRLKRSR